MVSDDMLLSITDKTGKIIYVNEKFCDVTKYSKNEILGKTHRILKSGYHPDSFYENLWQTISKGKHFSSLIKNKAKDGSTYWIMSIMIPTLDENSIPYQYVCVSNIASNIVNNFKKKNKTQTNDLIDLNIFKNALDNSSSVAITDMDGTITYANEMFCKLSKYSQNELVGKKHSMLKSGYHGRDFYENLWNTITSGKIWRGEIKNKAKDGTFYWVRTMIMPIFDDDKIKQFIAIRTDITPQMELAEKLVKAERLSSIGELASRLSHDIRNPLSVIQISFENLKIKYGTDDLKEKSFDKIQRSICRITHQIDDVLDFIRISSLILNKTKTTDVISDALDSLQIPDNIKVILPKNDVELTCDTKKLSTVFTNLILNGIQAIDGDGAITITVEEEDETIIFQVADSGKGISKEEQAKIFEPLFTTKQTGTGLGLASVNSIIKSHGGIISVTSPPTIFTIKLPKTLD